MELQSPRLRDPRDPRVQLSDSFGLFSDPEAHPFRTPPPLNLSPSCSPLPPVPLPIPTASPKTTHCGGLCAPRWHHTLLNVLWHQRVAMKLHGMMAFPSWAELAVAKATVTWHSGAVFPPEAPHLGVIFRTAPTCLKVTPKAAPTSRNILRAKPRSHFRVDFWLLFHLHRHYCKCNPPLVFFLSFLWQYLMAIWD